ncbi:MAG: hypothetical protein JW713_05825 [Pontiellaceae bacterium]|nr:hypothetical protein [Pontiellaceae bacterium]
MVPDAVKRAKEEAERLLKEQQVKAGVATGTPEAAPAPQATPAPQPQPQAEPAPAQPTAVQPEVQPQEPAPQQDGVIELSQINDPMQLRQMLMVDQDKMQKLQHKYDVLKGKYDAEVGRTGQRVRELEQMNGLLQNQLLQVQQAGSNPSINPQHNQGRDNDEIDLSKWYPQEVIDSYDEDLLKAQIRNQQRIIREEYEPVKRELAEAKGSIFESELRRTIPNFDALNEDDGFNAWLDEPEFAGESMTRRDKLDREVGKRNVGGISSFFSRYKPAQQETPAGTYPQNVLNQIAPQSAGAIQQPTAPPQKKIYSPQEYQQLKTLIASRQITGTRAEELNKELALAHAEGRIRA